MSRFDEIAKVWDAKPRRLEGARLVFEAIKSKININKNWIVADYGTGTGLLLIHFQPFVKKLFGFDNSESMLKMLDKKVKEASIKNVSRVLHDADKENLPENKFDLFVSRMTLHHISDVQNVLKQAYKSLKFGGKLAIADLETEDGTFHSEPNESIKHFGFNKFEFVEMLKNAGFKNINCETIFSIDKGIKKYPVFLAYAEKV